MTLDLDALERRADEDNETIGCVFLNTADFRQLLWIARAGEEVWDSVPGTFEDCKETRRHARALNVLCAALRGGDAG